MNIIFVMGMGRSGTSAMTRVLSLCGAALPDRILRPSQANPLGYFEPEVSLKRNDAFLRSLGSAYHDPGLRVIEDAAVQTRRRDAFQSHIESFLGGLPSAETAVIKDPRISGLAEIWIDVAQRLGHRVKIVHVFRNPDEVSASLAQRYSLSSEYSQSLWLKYNLLPERASRAVPRVFVGYGQLLADWELTLRRCDTRLGLGLDIGDDARAGVADFLRSELRHQVACALSPPADGSPSRWLRRTYSCLQAAALSDTLDVAELDRVYEEYAASERWFRNINREYQLRFPLAQSEDTAAVPDAAGKPGR